MMPAARRAAASGASHPCAAAAAPASAPLCFTGSRLNRSAGDRKDPLFAQRAMHEASARFLLVYKGQVACTASAAAAGADCQTASRVCVAR